MFLLKQGSDLDVVINSPATGQKMTKRDVVKYYADPRVQSQLFKTLKNRDLIAVVSRSPNQQFVRRYESKDIPLKIKNEGDLSKFVTRRYTEFHPVIGPKTREIWVDIDPGKNVALNAVKPVATDVLKIVKKFPGIKSTSLSFSGGSGFYVRGLLNRPQSTDLIRTKLREALKPLVEKREPVVLSVPKKDEVRLDISTLHDKGSIRAPYSLNSETGLVAVPIIPKYLTSFKPTRDATPEAAINNLKFFAPGIPQTKKIYPIPNVAKEKHWTLAVQEHNAARAGKHWDVRLVDPKSGYAHSWALPKAKFPELDSKPLLAIQQPTHTSAYALNFGLHKPETIGSGYGKGTVEIKLKEPVKMLEIKPDKIKFEKTTNGKPEQFMLFRAKDTSWLMRSLPMKKESAFLRGYLGTLEKLGISFTESGDDASIPNKSKLPMEIDDAQTPVGALTRLLQQLPEPTKRDDSPRISGNSIEARLNKRTTWDGGIDLPAMTGGTLSPVIGQY